MLLPTSPDSVRVAAARRPPGRWRSVRPRLPRGWRDAVLQLALWALADLLYEGVRGLVVGHRPTALANARAIVHLEQTLGVFHEVGAQRLVIHSHVAIDIANWVYANAQFSVNLAFLVFLYLFRNHVFYFVRNMFFLAMGVALVVHLCIPVAPPRMLPRYGFVDTIQRFAHIDQDTGAISLFVNPYAAVPSMHMCFGILVGLSGVRLTAGRRRWLWLAYPVIILSAITVTANHFFFDAVTGVALAAVAALAAHAVMSRVRPSHWSWRALPRGAPAGEGLVGAEA